MSKFSTKTHYGQRGPHEGLELRLMYAGLKPAALLDSYPDKIPKNWIVKKFLLRGKTFSYIIGLPNQEYRVSKLVKLFSMPSWYNKDIYHAKVGYLLGYHKEDIKFFIENKIV